MVKAGAISLKAVVPGLPKNSKDRELLEEDLRRIGCHGLLGKPWGLRMEEMWRRSLGRRIIGGTEQCAKPQRSGPRRSGERSTASNAEGKVWHPGPTGLLMECFPVR